MKTKLLYLTSSLILAAQVQAFNQKESRIDSVSQPLTTVIDNSLDLNSQVNSDQLEQTENLTASNIYAGTPECLPFPTELALAQGLCN